MKPIPLFDAHFHIIDPRFPLVENQGYLPPAFGCEDYLRRMADYRLLGGAVVSGSFQAFDQDYLVTALQDLGETYAGVTQLPANCSDEEIIKLDRRGGEPYVLISSAEVQKVSARLFQWRSASMTW